MWPCTDVQKTHLQRLFGEVPSLAKPAETSSIESTGKPAGIAPAQVYLDRPSAYCSYDRAEISVIVILSVNLATVFF